MFGVGRLICAVSVSFIIISHKYANSMMIVIIIIITTIMMTITCAKIASDRRRSCGEFGARAHPRLNLVLFYGPLQRTTGGSGNDRCARTKRPGNLYIYSSRALLYIRIYIHIIFVIISKRWSSSHILYTLGRRYRIIYINNKYIYYIYICIMYII